MKNIIGTIGAVGLVLCFAGVSTMETSFIVGAAVSIAGVGMIGLCAYLLSTFNVDWRI